MKLHKLFAAAMMTLGLITAGNTCIKEVCAAAEQTADQSVATEAETPADESTASEAAEEETVENTHRTLIILLSVQTAQSTCFCRRMQILPK